MENGECKALGDIVFAYYWFTHISCCPTSSRYAGPDAWIQVLGGLDTSPARSLRDRKSITRHSLLSPLLSNVEARALKHEKLTVHSFERVVRPGCFDSLLSFQKPVCGVHSAL